MSKFHLSSLHHAAANAAGLALVGLLAAAAPAHADPTLAFQGEPFGTETVTINNGTPPTSATVGAGQLQFAQDDGGVLSTLLAYCVDIFQTPSVDPVAYTYVGGNAYYGAEKADDLGRLFSGFDLWNTDNTVSSQETAALQLAVWEIVNETAMTSASVLDLDLSTGNFTAQSDNPGTAVLAQGWLDALPGVQNVYTVGALTNGQFQDQLVLSKVANNVPEPASIALVLGALGAMGAVTRRRKVGVATGSAT